MCAQRAAARPKPQKKLIMCSLHPKYSTPKQSENGPRIIDPDSAQNSLF